MRLSMSLVAAAAIFAGVPAAHAQSDVSKQIINTPAPESFAVYGLPDKPGVVKDKKVQGGRALRVAVPAASDQPWTIGLTSAVNQPVKKGDKLVIVVWVRAEKLPEGAATAKIAAIQLNLAKAPYSAVFTGQAEATGEWTMVHTSGVVDRDYAAGDLNVSLQIATGKQVLDFGPILLLDLNK